PFVADLSARSGRRARIWSDRGRMVVRFDLHHDVRGLIMRGEACGAGLRKETGHARATDDRGVIGIGAEHVAGGATFEGVTDHAEQAAWRFDTVDRPGRVEDLVAAVLAVRLREHHELDVGWIAAERGERVAQV